MGGGAKARGGRACGRAGVPVLTLCPAGRGAELEPEPPELSDSGDDAGWEDEDAEPAHGRQHTPCLFCDRFVPAWETRRCASEHVAGRRPWPAGDG